VLPLISRPPQVSGRFRICTLATRTVLPMLICHHGFGPAVVSEYVAGLVSRARLAPFLLYVPGAWLVVPAVMAEFCTWHARPPQDPGQDWHTPAAVRYCVLLHDTHCCVAELYPNATPLRMAVEQPPAVQTAVLSPPEHRAFPARQLAAVQPTAQNEYAGVTGV
jgi:hypothetical protein